MILAIILLIIGIIILRIEGSIGFIFGAGFVILAFIMVTNTAIVTPEKIPHRDKIAKVSKKTKSVVKHIKDEIDKKEEKEVKPELTKKEIEEALK